MPRVLLKPPDTYKLPLLVVAAAPSNGSGKGTNSSHSLASTQYLSTEAIDPLSFLPPKTNVYHIQTISVKCMISK